ncbi:MAG: CBS domain-containing protein [Alphaproteobacteria bacterium]|nr:CBS domain-containing protein [Alphaproteobacteria bacterium]
MQRKIVPDVVRDQKITLLPPTATVMDAVRLMSMKHVGAVIIGLDGKAEGIFTERDLLMRVVARGLDADSTPITRVMTRDPETLSPDQHASEALTRMAERGFRHLPVVGEDGRVVAIVSLRDLNAYVRRQLEEELQERDAFIHDTGYGATH